MEGWIYATRMVRWTREFADRLIVWFSGSGVVLDGRVGLELLVKIASLHMSR